MTTIILYIVYAVFCLLGIITLINGLLISIYFFIFRFRDIETLRSFLGGVTLWVGLVYLWKIIDGSQMPQLAIAICIVALFINMGIATKQPEHFNPLTIVKEESTNQKLKQTIYSQIITLVIILIVSFFIYPEIRWY